ncbi:hypothetical protein BIW11_11786, partial [Tropilaelaps mercedesae]
DLPSSFQVFTVPLRKPRLCTRDEPRSVAKSCYCVAVPTTHTRNMAFQACLQVSPANKRAEPACVWNVLPERPLREAYCGKTTQLGNANSEVGIRLQSPMTRLACPMCTHVDEAVGSAPGQNHPPA